MQATQSKYCPGKKIQDSNCFSEALEPPEVGKGF
jgi:hypothetical protein